jgi:hypothetical protein
MLLRTLGDVRLEGAANDLFGRRKDLTLLAYLARKAPRPVQRVELADLLWEDRDEARAKQSLRQALLELKRVVGDGLTADADQARLGPHAVQLPVPSLDAASMAPAITWPPGTMVQAAVLATWRTILFLARPFTLPNTPPPFFPAVSSDRGSIAATVCSAGACACAAPTPMPPESSAPSKAAVR